MSAWSIVAVPEGAILRHGDPCSIDFARKRAEDIRYVAEHGEQWDFCPCCVPSLQAVAYLERMLALAAQEGVGVQVPEIGNGEIRCGPIEIEETYVAWKVGRTTLRFTHEGDYLDASEEP